MPTIVRHFLCARDGNVALIFAIAAVPLALGVGTAVDYSRANGARTAMQAAADVAALAGASGSMSDSQRVTTASNVFAANYPASFGPSTTSTDVQPSKVTVTATGQVKMAFTGIFGLTTMTIQTTSVAVSGSTGQTACVLALQTSDDAIFVHGSANLSANCGLYSNSASNNGIDFDGDSVTTASSICVAGSYVRDADAKVTPSLPTTHCPAMPDPLASLPAPPEASASCDHNGFKLNSTGTLNPGVYCGGLEISGNITATFNPGTYVIRDGQFNMGSSSTLKGTGVFFYLTGQNANLNQGSSSAMTFSAPTSGTYKGIVFFQSRTANTPANQFGGSSSDNIQGAVYFPNGTAQIACSGGVSADYTIWVVKRLQLDSSASLKINNNYAGSATPVADGLSAMVSGKMAYLAK